MARETGVRSQVELYQRLKKWYLMLKAQHYNIRIKVKSSNVGKEVGLSSLPQCSSY